MALKQESQTTTATSFVTTCTATTWLSPYFKGMSSQQSSITVTPSVLATLTSTSDLYEIRLTFNTFPTGLSFTSSCSVASVATPLHYVTADYTTCTARLTAANTISFFITKTSDDDSAVITFGISEKFTLSFYVTHVGASATS